MANIYFLNEENEIVLLGKSDADIVFVQNNPECMPTFGVSRSAEETSISFELELTEEQFEENIEPIIYDMSLSE